MNNKIFSLFLVYSTGLILNQTYYFYVLLKAKGKADLCRCMGDWRYVSMHF